VEPRAHPVVPSHYGADLAAVHAAGFTDLARAAAEELLGALPARSSILEIGCGDGTTARLLTDAGHRVAAVDASPAMVRLAMEHAPRAAIRHEAGLEGLPAGVDAVLAAGEVLAYLPPRGSAPRLPLSEKLRRLAACLRPGGTMWFDVPGPGRAPDTGRRTWASGDGWTVLAEARRTGAHLTRDITVFTRVGGDRRRRREERHVLELHAPGVVLAAARAAGLDGEVLPGGYAGAPPPEGLVFFRCLRPR
jgi:SAM-dependent methyltransferase